VLTPHRIRVKELRPIMRLITSLGWPLIGLVTYAPSKGARLASGHRSRADESPPSNPDRGPSTDAPQQDLASEDSAEDEDMAQSTTMPTQGPAPRPGG
jgi:hypothetical protein